MLLSPVWLAASPPILNELHAPAWGHLRELEGSQSSRGRHTDSCHSDRDRLKRCGMSKKQKYNQLDVEEDCLVFKDFFKNAWRD